MSQEQITTLQTLIKDVQFNSTRLHEKNVKKASVELRKNLQHMILLCKTMRKEALEHRKSIPVKKRVKKDEPKPDEAVGPADPVEPELPISE